jgi:membrane protease YdiL (CAAX protease family)
MNFSARIRAFAWFFVAVVYFVFAKAVAERAAAGLAAGDWLELANRSILLFLLVFGYAGMGYLGQHQRQPIRAMGLDRRPAWFREFALGSALGWAGMVACVLPIVLIGGMVVTFYTTRRQFALIFLDLAILAVAALAEEVAFRGYPFQRLIEATNPTIATLAVSVLFGLIHLGNPGATFASTLVTIFAGWLLAIMYLRTRALWVAWGFHFTWNATMGILFGLPISGITNFSPVVATNAVGPLWITGGDYGPEGSLICALVIIVLIFVTFSATRDLKYRYAQPVIIPGGIPVDLDAISRRQHEAAMGPQPPPPPQIVQISGIQTPNSREEASPAPAPLGGEAVPTPITPAEVPPRETR